MVAGARRHAGWLWLMNVEVVQARDPNELARAARRAAEALAAGGLVVHPTETVYGLGGDGSVENNTLIAQVKRRNLGQPLIVLTPDIETARATYRRLEWPEAADKLAKKLWPGPLTIVVRCEGAPAGLIGAGGGLALRVSPNEIVRTILRVWKRPMTSTSANFSGQEPARSVTAALELFAGRVDLLKDERPVVALDAGPIPETRPSTIVSFVQTPPRLLREGPVSRAQLLTCLPDLE